MNLPLLKNYSIVSVCSDAWADKFPEETTAVDERLMQWVGLGQLRPHVSRVLPLEQTAEAMASVMDRTVQGRVGPDDHFGARPANDRPREGEVNPLRP